MRPLDTAVLHVGGIGLWTPGLADPRAWLSGVADPAQTLPAAALLPAAVRRRTSLLTRAAAEVFAQAIAASGADPAEVATVFVSAWGETSALRELLDQLHGPDGTLSPIRFSGSVHNAASGNISIATGNRGFTTSLAAGPDSVAMGLCECLGLLAAGFAEVVAVFADLDPPTPLADRSGHCTPLAVALHLHAGRLDRPVLATLSGLDATPGMDASARLATGLYANPCAGAWVLADAVLRRSVGRIALGPAGRGDWSVEVSAGAA